VESLGLVDKLEANRVGKLGADLVGRQGLQYMDCMAVVHSHRTFKATDLPSYTFFRAQAQLAGLQVELLVGTRAETVGDRQEPVLMD